MKKLILTATISLFCAATALAADVITLPAKSKSSEDALYRWKRYRSALLLQAKCCSLRLIRGERKARCDSGLTETSSSH